MCAKYVVVKGKLCESIIIFPRHERHSDVAERMGGEVVSAGFMSIAGEHVDCFGESESLKLGSRPAKDEQLARMALGLEVA